MHLPARSKTLSCEQCGAPLLHLPGEEGCLNCLLSTGIDGETAPAGVMPNESRNRFFQHYEILTRPDGSPWELGRGPMGVTYKARHVSLDAIVALKVINARFRARPEVRERFLREARAAAQLRHPNVASVVHFATTEAGDCFYAMEFIEGESLETRLRRTGPLEMTTALEIGLQVARALAAGEKRGLANRDLRPASIMLAEDEEPEGTPRGLRRHGAAWVRVIDFGLTKSADEAQDLDARSDIYSLGAILLYSLTGEIPRSDRPLSLASQLSRNVPPAVVALLQAMLASDPRDRPDSAQAVADTLERLIDGRSEETRGSPKRAYRWAIGAGLAAAGLVALAFYLSQLAPSRDDKSIAVLPFRNLSGDPANAFFAEGVQDDILSRLVKVRDLKVVGRRGTLHEAPNGPRDLRAIGRALGVRHVLEGSLRRSGDRVLLHVSLVDVSDEREIWSEGYDRRLVDAINLQGELASDIADALKARLSSAERVGVRASTTHNPDAYVLYLRGRKLENSPNFLISNFEAAKVLYQQAVTVDPGFALAHARLASSLGLLYRFAGPGAELKRRAFAEAREALRLQPDLGEAHLALGLCSYRITREFDRALQELEIAGRLLPNDTEPDFSVAIIRRRQGRWREARRKLEQVQARDPLNRKYEEELLATAALLRDWPQAALHGDHAMAILPVIPPLKAERALVDVWANGNLAPLQKALAEMASFPDAEGPLTWERWDAAMLSRDFAHAQEIVEASHFDALPSVIGAPIPLSYLQGCVQLAQGKSAQARQSFEQARPALEAEAIAHLGDAMRHARLGLLYAYMGRRFDALREGERAAEISPVNRDALDGHEWQCYLALIHARLGDADMAISMVDSLLRQPGCVSPLNEAALTLSDLRLRWQWDPLRRDPRFQKILAGPEPATIY